MTSGVSGVSFDGSKFSKSWGGSSIRDEGRNKITEALTNQLRQQVTIISMQETAKEAESDGVFPEKRTDVSCLE